VPLTHETEPFRETVEVLRNFSVFGPSILRRMTEILDDMNNSAGRGSVGMRARGLEIEEKTRSMETLRLLAQFCDALSGRPGRTALVWVSMGVKLTEGGPFTALAGVDPFSTFTPDRRIVERQQELHEAANNANVSIYGIDPTLSSEQRSLGFDMSVGSAQLLDLAGTPEVQGALDGLRDTLSNAATATGGQTFLQASDITSALSRIESDSSRFYLLSYTPPTVRGDGQYHEIRVEVARPGVNVRERRGYVDLPADDRETRRVTAALALPGMMKELPVLAKAFRRWSPEGDPIVQLAVGIDAGVRQTENGTEGGLEGTAEGSAPTWHMFHAMAITEQDKVVEEAHREVRPLSGSTSDDTQTSTRPFVYYVDWELAPGEYSIRVALEDELSDRIGAARLELEVPEPTDEWRTSDLILAVSEGDQEPGPLVSGTVTPDETLLAYLEVSGGRAPILTGDLFNADGTVRLAQLPPLVLDRDRVGLHRGALRLRGIPPGEYTLQITVTDPSADEHRVFRERLAVVR